jgi:phosphatidylglycerol---prolipoprotein diacylglyceryl transferase
MFNIAGLEFHAYGLMLGLAIVASWSLSSGLAKKKEVNFEKLEGLIMATILGGLIGARIYHVIDYWNSYYALSPIKVLYLWEGGLAIWGAVIGGAVTLMAGYKVQIKNLGKLKLMELLDLGAYGMPVAQAIGRLGNYANGELVGKNGEPLFAIEAILNLVLFGVIWKYMRNTKSGMILGTYLIGYGLIRLALEKLRPEEIIWYSLGLPMAMWMSMVAIAIGTWIVITSQRQS